MRLNSLSNITHPVLSIIHSKQCLSRSVLLLTTLFSLCFFECQAGLDHRSIAIINETDIAFSLQPYAFGTADFSPFSYELKNNSRVDFSLNSPDSIQSANGIVVFMLAGHHAFSLVMKDQIVSVHGCKSKNVFYHPADYVCVLKNSDNGASTLRVMRPSDA